jgi:hypothetical protein
MPGISPPAAAPGGPPPQGAQQPQQAPFGSTSATGPTPNKGYEAAAMQRVGVLVKAMTDILPQVGATSDLGQALMKSITLLAKHVPPGTNSNAAEKNSIEKMDIQNQINGAMQQQLKQPGQAAQIPPSMPKPAQMPQAA